MPSSTKARWTMPAASASSRFRMWPPVWKRVTSEPRRLKACASSQPMGPAPRPLDQLEHVLVGEKAGVAEAGHVRVTGAGARGDDGLLESQGRAVDLDRVRPGEAPVAQEDVDAEAGEALGGVVVADSRADTAHALHHRAEVGIDRSRHPDAERGGGADITDHPR